MRRLVALVALLATFGWLPQAEACNRCGRYYTSCVYYKAPAAVAAPAPVVVPTKTDVFVVMNNHAAPLVAQGGTGFASTGGYQQQAQQFDPNLAANQEYEFLRALGQMHAQTVNGKNALISNLALAYSPVSRTVATGNAAALTLGAVGAASQTNGNSNSSQSTAFVVTQDSTGRVTAQSLTREQTLALNGDPRLQGQPAPQPPAQQPEQSAGPPLPPAPQPGGYPLLQKFCYACHGLELAQPKKGFYIGDNPQVAEAMEKKWYLLTGSLSGGNTKVKAMPPADSPQPTQEEKVAIINELQSLIDANSSGR